DLIVGAGPGGGPRVQGFSGQGLMADQKIEVANFFAGNVENRGGVRATMRNLDGDGFADLVVGDGEGAGSRVTAYAGKTLSNITPIPLYAFDEAPPGFTGGVFVG